MSFTTILIRRSTTSGSIPSPGSLAIGELALNAGVGDGTLFYLESGGLSVRPIRAGSASFAVTAAFAMNGGGGGGSPIEVRDEGTVVTSTLSAINFVGAGVSASLSASVVVVTINGSSATTGSFTGSFTGAHTGSYTGSFRGQYTGSYTGSVTGGLFGTASYGVNSLTASYALNGGRDIEVTDENTVITSTLLRINFTGAGVSSSLSGSTVNVSIPGGSGSVGPSGIEVRDEGTFISSSVGVLNFLGNGVTAALSGNVVNVTIPGGSGSGGGSTSSLEVRDEGIQITPSASVLNFVGSGVTAQVSGNVVNVAISGGGSGSGSLGRAVSSVSTPSLAPGQRITGSIATFGKSYILLTVDTNTDSRIRLYGSASYMQADLTRSIGTDPVTENGLVVDLVLSGSPQLYNFTLSPIVNGANVEPTPADTAYYTITNLSAASASVSVNFNRIVLEA